MPKTRKKEEIRCPYYRWLLGRRNGVYYADGRSNDPSLGRPSLGERDRHAALKALSELDLTMAVRHGRADASQLRTSSDLLLPLADGRCIYEQHIQRPAVAGGPRKSTTKRYRTVLDKFLRFMDGRGLQHWNDVDRQVLDAYAAWLDGESYAYATEYLELTTIKQILKYLVEIERLPASASFAYPLRKPEGTDTYCWRPEEVAAIIKYCDTEDLRWLRAVVITLAATGMRISELASLRWSDVDMDNGTITLTDESTRRSAKGRQRRTTKTGQSRAFPIHAALMEVLQNTEQAADGLVFHGPRGGQITANTVRRILLGDVLTPLASKFPVGDDQIGFIDGRLHSFRHYFCSNCANAGTPERVLMSWLGHRSSKMVQRYYHLHTQESRRQMERVALY